MNGRPPARGFTLIEVASVVLLLSVIVTFVYQVLFNTIRQRDSISEGLEGPKIDNSILDEIVRDLRFVYYRAGQFPGDAGFWGRSREISGKDADRIDFLTCRTSRLAQLEDTNQTQVNSPLVEVGYACRPNDANSDWIELWRREDYFADDDPTDGGRYDLVYDKVRKFDLRYYPPTDSPERAANDNGFEEWDTKVLHKLPYAIVVTLQFDVREPISRDTPQVMVRRIVLLTPSRSVAPDAGMTGATGAMNPVMR